MKKYFKKVIVLPGKNLAQGLPVPLSIPAVFTERVIDIAATRSPLKLPEGSFLLGVLFARAGED
ncbi:MAG: hypothetical protein V8S74_07870 [Lachnospirales bacterium]